MELKNIRNVISLVFLILFGYFAGITTAYRLKQFTTNEFASIFIPLIETMIAIATLFYLVVQLQAIEKDRKTNLGIAESERRTQFLFKQGDFYSILVGTIGDHTIKPGDFDREMKNPQIKNTYQLYANTDLKEWLESFYSVWHGKVPASSSTSLVDYCEMMNGIQEHAKSDLMDLNSQLRDLSNLE